MWREIKKLLTGASDDQGGATGVELDEARICATALLVEAALSDGVYAEIEADQITQIVRESFGLDDAKAAVLIEEAETRAEAAVDQHGFTKVVKRLPLAEREGLVESLWRVVFADGEESPDEEAMVRKLADLLHVDPRASRIARRRAADGGPPGE